MSIVYRSSPFPFSPSRCQRDNAGEKTDGQSRRDHDDDDDDHSPSTANPIHRDIPFRCFSKLGQLIRRSRCDEKKASVSYALNEMRDGDLFQGAGIS